MPELSVTKEREMIYNKLAVFRTFPDLRETTGNTSHNPLIKPKLEGVFLSAERLFQFITLK